MRTGDYLNIPDHSDLRGFSYHAPTNFDYRDEQKKPKTGFWQKLKAIFGKGSA